MTFDMRSIAVFKELTGKSFLQSSANLGLLGYEIVQSFETSSEGLKNKLTYLEKKYEANSEKLKAYKRKVEDTKIAIAKKEEELQRNRQKIHAYKRGISLFENCVGLGLPVPQKLQDTLIQLKEGNKKEL